MKDIFNTAYILSSIYLSNKSRNTFANVSGNRELCDVILFQGIPLSSGKKTKLLNVSWEHQQTSNGKGQSWILMLAKWKMINGRCWGLWFHDKKFRRIYGLLKTSAWPSYIYGLSWRRDSGGPRVIFWARRILAITKHAAIWLKSARIFAANRQTKFKVSILYVDAQKFVTCTSEM